MTIFQPSPRYVTRHGERYLPYAKAAPGTSRGTAAGGGTAGNLAAAAAQGALGAAAGADGGTGAIQQFAEDTAQDIGQLGGGAVTQTNQGGGQFSEGVGFRDIPGYGPAAEADTLAVPAVEAPEDPAQEVIQDFTDDNPYDDSPAAAGPTYRDYQSGSYGGGNLGNTGSYGSGSGFDRATNTFGTNYFGPSTNASRGAASRGLGYASGDPSFGAIGSLASAVSGVPFIGGLAGRAADAARSGEGRPLQGDPGTIDPVTGGIYGSDGGVYDPITNRRIQGSFGNRASAGDIATAAGRPFTGADDPFAPTATAAGIRNLPHERAVSQQRQVPGQGFLSDRVSAGFQDRGDPFADRGNPYYNPRTNPSGTLVQPFGPTRGTFGDTTGLGLGSLQNRAIYGQPQGNASSRFLAAAGPQPFTPAVQSAQQLYTGEAPAQPAGPTVAAAAAQPVYGNDRAANKAQADREAEEQTGIRGASAVTDSSGRPVRSSSGNVVTSGSSVSDSGQDSGGGGGGK